MDEPVPEAQTTSLPELSGVARAGALAAFEECGDALVVYQRALRIEQNRVVERRRRPGVRYWQRTSAPPPPPPLPEASMKYLGEKFDKAAFEMAADQVVFHKLLQDSKWLEELILASKRSLASEGRVDPLVKEVAIQETARQVEEELLRRARYFQDEYERLCREIDEERQRRGSEEASLQAELLKLQNEKEQAGVSSRVESGYARAWLDSRQDQELRSARASRQRLADELTRCRLREDNERLVTRNVADFLRKSIQENEAGAEEWAKRRETESKDCDVEIRRLQAELELRQAELKTIKHEYAERQEFVDLCMAEREAARRAKQLEDHIRGCAVRIQAWWRGVMVRRKLGPYRPEDKKRKRPPKLKK